MTELPVIDIQPLLADSSSAARQSVAAQLRHACLEHGFFFITGHSVSHDLQNQLEQLSRQFFAQQSSSKMRIRMELGGRAWRGYFPVGNELTSGQPDQKEGLYFGQELTNDHNKVQAGVPLHGGNLFPPLEGFRETVLTWIDRMTEVGHALMRAIALSLDLDAAYFDTKYTSDPLVLFRIFHYPPLRDRADELWSVGEHTDYGLLTILKQDNTGGLQVKTKSQWIDVPVIEDAFVCNLGDMLDRMTGGLYRSTPHRVRNSAATGRLSFPFFFDPNWDAEIQPVPCATAVEDDSSERWDGANVHDWQGHTETTFCARSPRCFHICETAHISVVLQDDD